MGQRQSFDATYRQCSQTEGAANVPHPVGRETWDAKLSITMGQHSFDAKLTITMGQQSFDATYRPCSQTEGADAVPPRFGRETWHDF